MSEQHILVTGNPVDGFTFIGPFADVEPAEREGERQDQEWWVALLSPPNVRTWHINVYEQHRNYGGPEEGGWWFDSGVYQPKMSVTFDGSPEDANAYALDLHDRLKAEADANQVPYVSSVAYNGGRYMVQTDDKPGADWPVERPHYE